MLSLNLPPTLSSTSIQRSIIRRRNITPPNLREHRTPVDSNGERAINSPLGSHHTLESVRDVDDIGSEPTVLLVQRSVSYGTPLLEDNFPFFDVGDGHDSMHATDGGHGSFRDLDEVGEHFSAVQLTPRPEMKDRGFSNTTHATRISQIPRLPTPDFTAPRASFPTTMSQVMNFFRGSSSGSKSNETPASNAGDCAQGPTYSSPVPSSSLRPSSSKYLSPNTRQFFKETPRLPSIRVSDDLSLESPLDLLPQASSTIVRSNTPSRCSTGNRLSRSVTSNAESLAESPTTSMLRIPTTDKFTNKWPRPQSTRRAPTRTNTSRRKYQKLSVSADEFTEHCGDLSEVGLGFEGADRWTTPKWCLIISVVSVFAYAAAALVYSILTWYQSKSLITKTLAIVAKSW